MPTYIVVPHESRFRAVWARVKEEKHFGCSGRRNMNIWIPQPLKSRMLWMLLGACWMSGSI